MKLYNRFGENLVSFNAITDMRKEAASNFSLH